jgi:hypothetical protein
VDIESKQESFKNKTIILDHSRNDAVEKSKSELILI